RVNAGADDSRCDAGGQIAIADQTNARASSTNIADQLLVARTIQNDYNQVFDLAIQPAGDRFEVVLNGRINVDHALARGTDHNFFHVAVGRIQQTAFLAGRQYSDGTRRSCGAKIRAFERIDGNIDGCIAIGTVALGAHLFADVEHRRLVALALTDHDGPAH